MFASAEEKIRAELVDRVFTKEVLAELFTEIRSQLLGDMKRSIFEETKNYEWAEFLFEALDTSKVKTTVQSSIKEVLEELFTEIRSQLIEDMKRSILEEMKNYEWSDFLFDVLDTNEVKDAVQSIIVEKLKKA